MANGAMDLTGWHVRWLTPEEIAAEDEAARLECEERDRRWPPSQRRPRCPDCGAFTKYVGGAWWLWTCKNCGSDGR